MKVISLCFITMALVLSGCSLNEGTEKLYKQENVLQVDIVVPPDLNVGQQYELQANFTEREREVPDIEEVTFTLWKNGEESEERILSEDEGQGVYTIHTSFEEEGLYFVKVTASTEDSRVMPTKRLVVGDISEEDMNSLPTQQQDMDHEGHH
ncbi:FixH family protein [Caldalkalibacillus salinus]|uniref:FixH family protein n=1 Tax=Caldalkalibacillus salinus TaxID=2803787 RepID=UPI0019244DC9|nr:FixH family protein [Caldalkalibacillus salinus]